MYKINLSACGSEVECMHVHGSICSSCTVEQYIHMSDVKLAYDVIV